MDIRLNCTMPIDLIRLMERCGKRKHDPKTLIRSMRDCLFMAGIYDEATLVAYGRVCGDGAMYFLICDFLVDPKYNETNLDMKIYKEIDDYLLTVVPNDGRVIALTDKKYERVFRAFGYQYMDRDYRTAMIRE